MDQTTNEPSEGEASEAPAAPPADPSPPPRRLARRSDDRIVAGVASGIADYFDVNPWLVRVAFVLLTFAGFSGVILYILGILLLPRETDPLGASPIERIAANPGKHGWVPWIVLAVALIALTNGFTVHHSIVWPLLLVGLGIYLLRDHPSAQPVAATGTIADATPVAGTSITTPAYGGVVRPRERRRHRKQSMLGLLTIGVALLVSGLVAMLAQSETIHLHVQQVLAVPIVMLGLGILVGTFYGRARWLAFLALLMLPFVVVASVANVPVNASHGVKDYRPAAIADVSAEYELGVGRQILDLSKVRTDAGPRVIDIHTGVGDTVVVIPKDVPTSIVATAGMGRVDVLGRMDGGPSSRLTAHTTGQGGELVVKVHTGVGRAFVTDNPNAPEATTEETVRVEKIAPAEPQGPVEPIAPVNEKTNAPKEPQK